MLRRNLISLALASAMLTPLAAPAYAQSSPRAVQTAVALERPIVSRHEGRFNGRRVAYDAFVERVATRDAQGVPTAQLGVISYVARDQGAGHERPVIFIFNGGPGAASHLLHMGAMGPKRLAIPDDINAPAADFRVIENKYSLLDVADLVFFDPPGTGFSRMEPGVSLDSQHSVAADATQLVELVRGWTAKHGRQNSPRYLIGESYGTVRVAEAASQLQAAGLPLDGAVMISQGVNILEYAQRPGNIISFVVSLPTLSAIAWSHGRADRQGRSFEQFIADASAFGGGEYLNLLFLGDKAPEDRRRIAATKLEEFTGISRDYYLSHDLKITKQEYRFALFPGQVLGEHDARYVGPVAGGDPFRVGTSGYARTFKEYLDKDLHAAQVGSYINMDPIGFNDWDWGPNRSPFGNWDFTKLITGVFEANPRFHLMVANGYYDTQTTVGAMDYLVNQSPWPSDRVTSASYQGGHMAYTVEGSLERLNNDIRRLIERSR